MSLVMRKSASSLFEHHVQNQPVDLPSLINAFVSVLPNSYLVSSNFECNISKFQKVC